LAAVHYLAQNSHGHWVIACKPGEDPLVLDFKEARATTVLGDVTCEKCLKSRLWKADEWRRDFLRAKGAT
jgi:hypothetical protein